jgi:hypothetical protein
MPGQQQTHTESKQSKQKPKQDLQQASDEHYDVGVEDTFPASDPPSHGEIVGPPHEESGSKKQKKPS